MTDIAIVYINDSSNKTVTGQYEFDRANDGILVPPQVADATARLALTPAVNEIVWQQDTEELYRWDGAAWQQLSASLAGTVPDTRLVTAGAGLTGGGALSGDVTLDVVAADGSIVVGADDIAVGVINDTQHGTRGGGNLHAAATAGVAGFMSSVDKAKLDTVESNAKDDQVAVEVPFTPNGDIAAVDVQNAIVEVRDDTDAKIASIPAAPVDSVFGRIGAVVAVAGDYTAAQVNYNNATSGLAATETQAAIDEVEARVDAIEAAVPASLAAFAQDLPISTIVGTTSFQPKVTTGPVALPAGTYKIMWSYGWNHDANTNDFEGRLLQNGAQVGELHKQEPKDSGGGDPTGTTQRYYTSRSRIDVLAASTYTWAIEYRTDSAGAESSIWEATIEIWRVA